MEQKLIELFTECYNECDLADKIAIHNTYCCENNCGDDEIFENGEDFFNTFFEGDPDKAVRAAFYGDYRYGDDYVWFNGYANLESGDFESQLPLEDEKTMAKFFVDDNYDLIDHIDAMDEFVDACKYGFDDDEEDVD